MKNQPLPPTALKPGIVMSSKCPFLILHLLKPRSCILAVDDGFVPTSTRLLNTAHAKPHQDKISIAKWNIPENYGINRTNPAKRSVTSDCNR